MSRLDEAALQELVALATTDPTRFAEQYRRLSVLARLQLRRYLYERLRATGTPPPGLQELTRAQPAAESDETSLDAAMEQMLGEEGSQIVPPFDDEGQAGTAPVTEESQERSEPESSPEDSTAVEIVDSNEAADIESSSETEMEEISELSLDESEEEEVNSLEALFGAEEQEPEPTTPSTPPADSGEAFSLEDLFTGEEEMEAEEETQVEKPAIVTVDAEGHVQIPDEYTTPKLVSMDPERVAQLLRRFDLFEGLSEAFLLDLATKMQGEQYPSGALLCRQGDAGDRMWLILEGSIRVLPNDQDIGVVLEAGEIVGEMSLLDGSPRSATLMTDSPTLLLSYTLEAYENTFRDSPQAGLAFLRNLIRRQQNRLRETTQRAAEEAAAKARVEGEIRQAQQTQQLALPDRLPEFGNCEFAVSYKAAREVSGDYYDFLELPENPDQLIVLFGDSTGHGLNAGLLMLIAKSAATTQARIEPSVIAITAAINDIICDVFEATLFMTFVCALIDRQSRTIEYTNAGQQSHPYLLRVKTDEFVPLSSQTFQLGVQKGAQYTSETISYEPGDLLIFYSDGIIEAPYCPPGANTVDRSQEFGDERLREILLRTKEDSPQQIIDTLLEEARNFCVFFDSHMTIGGEEYDGDDVTNLVIRLD